jgi:hypothetical protein
MSNVLRRREYQAAIPPRQKSSGRPGLLEVNHAGVSVVFGRMLHSEAVRQCYDRAKGLIELLLCQMSGAGQVSSAQIGAGQVGRSQVRQ